MSEGLLALAAQALGPLCTEVVFVGGAAVHLWITDPAAPATRSTDDVDVITAVGTRIGYYAFGERLRERGFAEDSSSNVICRWRHRDPPLILDVMPQDEEVLGFSNPWYGYAIETAVDRELQKAPTIRAATAVAMLATKLAAWRGRGRGDALRSLDVHDVIVLADGRPELADELAAAPEDLRGYVASELMALNGHRDFDSVVESALQSYGSVRTARAEQLLTRLELLCSAGPRSH